MATSLQNLFQWATGTVSTPTSVTAPPAIVRPAPAATPTPTSSVVPTTPVATGIIPPWKGVAPNMGAPLPAKAGGLIFQTPMGIPRSPSMPVPVIDSSQSAVIAAAASGTPSVMPAVPQPSIEERLAADAAAGGTATSSGASAVGGEREGRGALIAGAAGGFLVGGPIGAVVGAIVANMISKKPSESARPVPVQGFDGLSFKKLGKAIGSAVKGTKSAISRTLGAGVSATESLGRGIDITSRSSVLGRIPIIGRPAVTFARQAIATSAAMATGGLSVVAAQKGVISKSTFGASTTAQGFVTGAVVGAAILGGQGISGLKSKTPGQQAIEATAD